MEPSVDRGDGLTDHRDLREVAGAEALLGGKAEVGHRLGRNPHHGGADSVGGHGIRARDDEVHRHGAASGLVAFARDDAVDHRDAGR